MRPPLIDPKLERWLELAAALSGLLIQFAVWAAASQQLTATQHGRQAAMCALWATVILLCLVTPTKAWLRYRFLLITVARVALGSVPSNRSITEGPAVILHAPATPGVLGALRDYMRVAVGSRLLLATLMGTLLHQPPALLLMQQIALMWLVRADYCSCSLFQDPLSQARIATAWDVLELASLFVQPWGTRLGARPSPQLQCEAVLTFHKLAVGIVLPTAVAVYLGRQHAWASTAPAAQQGQQELAQQGQQEPAQQLPEAGGQPLACTHPAAATWLGLMCIDDRLTSGWKHLAQHPTVACLAAWVTVGNLWVAAAALAQL